MFYVGYKNYILQRGGAISPLYDILILDFLTPAGIKSEFSGEKSNNLLQL